MTFDLFKGKLLTVADILTPEVIAKNKLDGTNTNLGISKKGQLSVYKTTLNYKAVPVYEVELADNNNISLFTKEFRDFITVEKKINGVVEVAELKKKLKDAGVEGELALGNLQASFPGGDSELMRWLGNNVKYPAIAEENGVQGRVIVRFFVDTEGNIQIPEVLRSVDPSLDKEALRVVKSMPKWIPAKKDGKALITVYTLPVTFQLQ